METESSTATTRIELTHTTWLAGAAGGFVGSLLFGLFLQYVIPAPMLEMAIPAMYGIEGPALAAGWAIHQVHGVVLGLAYVGIVQFGPLRERARRFPAALAVGVWYGVVTTVGLAVLVMPLWLSAVGFAAGPPFPNLGIPDTPMSILGHVLFAVPVAVAYAMTVEDTA